MEWLSCNIAFVLSLMALSGCAQSVQDCQCSSPQPLCPDGDSASICTERADGSCNWTEPECPGEEANCGGFESIECDSGSYCHWNLEGMCGGTDNPGTCRPVPNTCPSLYAPVCGCDGITYENECVANAHGISIQSETPCPPEPEQEGNSCGGVNEVRCAEGLYCDMSDVPCSEENPVGVCRDEDDRFFCTADYSPVCGCDGNTYSNECAAHVAGIGVERPGEC